MRQIIVIGPPRSGTSVIARMLQENLGVMMDEGPVKRDKNNPYGYYEDHRVVAINTSAANRRLKNRYVDNKMDVVWATQFAQWVSYRALKYPDRPWGFKDPGCVGFINCVAQFFKDPVWIVCDRSTDQIIKSQKEKIKINPDIIYQGLITYRHLIEKYLKSYYKFDLTVYQPEHKLTEKLRKILWP